ncbi:MAG: hypothetical protein EOP36_08765 [Rubrivivax sp.]|nr:MAG: hypothetical protein EOP36_08765 [Rubrivivax sp.]
MMNVKSTCLSILACSVLVLSSADPAHAEDKTSREREALRRAQQSLRQTQEERDALASEKASLAQAKDQLDGQLKQTSAKVKGAESKATSERARAAQLESTLRSKDEALTAAQAREAELADRLRKAEAGLADKSRLLENVSGMLARSAQAQQTLEAQNSALYATGLELVDVVRSQSPSAWLKARDGLLGFQGVRVENLAESFRTKLDVARYNKKEASAAAASASLP